MAADFDVLCSLMGIFDRAHTPMNNRRLSLHLSIIRDFDTLPLVRRLRAQIKPFAIGKRAEFKKAFPHRGGR